MKKKRQARDEDDPEYKKMMNLYEIGLEVIKKPSEDRNPSDIKILSNLLESTHFFSKILDRSINLENFYSLASKLVTYEKRDAGSVIMGPEDLPDIFYLILKGTVRKFTPKTTEELEKDSHENKKNQLSVDNKHRPRRKSLLSGLQAMGPEENETIQKAHPVRHHHKGIKTVVLVSRQTSKKQFNIQTYSSSTTKLTVSGGFSLNNLQSKKDLDGFSPASSNRTASSTHTISI